MIKCAAQRRDAIIKKYGGKMQNCLASDGGAMSGVIRRGARRLTVNPHLRNTFGRACHAEVPSFLGRGRP